MTKKNEPFLRPYRRVVGDKIMVGFELLKRWDLDKSDKVTEQQTNDHYAWMAQVFAFKFQEYSLTHPDHRTPIFEYDPVTEVKDGS